MAMKTCKSQKGKQYCKKTTLPEEQEWPRRGRSRNRLEWPGQRQQPRWPKPRRKPLFLFWPQPVKQNEEECQTNFF